MHQSDISGFPHTNRSLLTRYIEILHVLVTRNLKVRYRGSILGVYWSLLNPLAMTGIYTAIFGTAFAFHYNNSIVHYSLQVFVGLAVMSFFTASTTQALQSVVSNGLLMNKIRLPVSVFPTSIIAANVFQFTVGTLPLLVIMALATSHRLLNALLLPLPLLALICLCLGIGLLMSGLYVFFRDLAYFYELMTFLVLLSSPIFYPAAIVPAKVQLFLNLNPLTSIIESFRQIALSGAVPDFGLIGISLLSGGVVLAIGHFWFQRWQHQFMDLL